MPKEDKTKKPTETVKPASTIDYSYVGSGDEKKKKTGSKGYQVLIPSGKMITGLVIVILGVLIITALNFPFSSFLSGNLSATASVGYPFIFMTFTMSGESSNLIIKELLFDLAIYLLLAYIFNIVLSLLGNVSHFKTKEKVDEKPSIFKDQVITKTDKLAEKISQ